MTEEETTHKMLMELIKEECTIDTTQVMEYPPTALSYGEKNNTNSQRRFNFSNTHRNLWEF